MFRCFQSVYGLLALAAAAALAIYLVIWHGRHLAALLPFVLILLCPLSHLLMHRHGSDHHHPSRSENNGDKVPR
jgi:Flp pilus assembly protein TadB